MRTLERALAVVAGLPLATGVVAAHEVGTTRFDAPIPLSLLFVGAAAAVAATAVWLAASGRPVPESTVRVATIRNRWVGAVTLAGRLGFTAVVAFAVYRGLVGRPVAAENLATLFVWPVWLKGLAVLAVLVGDPWPLLSPWRGVHSLLERIEGGRVRLASYPVRLGVWPAVLGFVVVVGVVENLTVVPRSPRHTVGVVALYAAAMVVGGLAFGRTWYRRADFLAVLYRQLGRVAPLTATADDDGYVVTARFPWHGCTTTELRAGAVTFVVAMVYTVSFDGFTNTPAYQTLVLAVGDALGTGRATGPLLYLAGFVAFVGTYVVAAALVERLGGSVGTTGAAANAFAPTVVPIAAAYEVAHNYPFVVRNAAQVAELVLEALGAPHVTLSPLSWLSLPLFWGSQVVLIVLGHVVAVVAAHAVACHRYESLARARRAHLPLVVLMIGYTVLSLWIISRPVVSA